MPTSLPTQPLYPHLGYLTRRQPPGTGIPPGTEVTFEAEAAVAG
ncbi:MAG: hypothetical protein QOG31_695 [Thermoplasmata archaeon]|jgi:hypothetical protein|nr:hypothetical protein [Thermoplasmata archaeon]HUR63521.1 hypothetical protein [Candidatus Thermoplasmatota archaeon]